MGWVGFVCGSAWRPLLTLLVFAQTVPFGDLFPGALAHLPPVFHAARCDAVCPQDQPPHHLVFRSAVKVDDQEFDADVWEKIHGDVVDEGLVEDGVQSAFLDVGFLFGYALSAVVHVHLDVGIWQRETRSERITQARNKAERAGLELAFLTRWGNSSRANLHGAYVMSWLGESAPMEPGQISMTQ